MPGRDGVRAFFGTLTLAILGVLNLGVAAMLAYIAYEIATAMLRLPRPVLLAALVLTGMLVLARLASRPPTLGRAILHELAGIRLGQSLHRR